MRRSEIIAIIVPFTIGTALEIGNYENRPLALLFFGIAGLMLLWTAIATAVSRWKKHRKPILLDLDINPLSQALRLSCRALSARYAADAEYFGIRWRPEFVNVRLDIQNAVNVPIEDIEIVVRFDTALVGIGQTTHLQMESDVLPTMSLDSISVGIEGEEAPDVPMTGNPDVFSATSNNSGRLRLPLIPGGFNVHLVFATVAMSALKDKQQRAPEWIKVEGQYETAEMDGRERYDIEFRHEFR